ncbi:MAG TPA: hypothetical protein VMU04_05060 [Candidatus Acidoferrum sp.]|nr:hypothetical protein [Candidatus Acidoferrum sp.]
MKTASPDARVHATQRKSIPTARGDTSQDYVLKLSALYHDDQTREWAQDVYRLARQLVGKQSVRATWWNIGDLNEPAVLAGAVSKAMHSDVIVVSMRADSGLPLAFYYWADAWLPHRVHAPGALVGLIGVADHAHTKSDRTREYLRILSRRGGLEFLCDERPLTRPSVAGPTWHEAVGSAVLRTMACGGARLSRFHRTGRLAA